MKIIDIIKKEKREREEIINAIDARAKRLAQMTDEERATLDNEIATESAQAWDFLKEV